MQSIQEVLKAYGVDYVTTMERFMGNEALYLKLLKMLLQDGNVGKLGAALDAGSLRDAFEAAHALKGAVGNMGLTPLYESLCAIVEPLRMGEQRGDYDVLYGVVQAEFQNVKELEAKLNHTQST